MPPQNAGYYHAAYIVAVAVYTIYTITLLRRRAKVREALEREEQARSARG
jgi:ABC-type transport system involved in Fe-S cluster assembly fused permease/ATPase subunit